MRRLNCFAFVWLALAGALASGSAVCGQTTGPTDLKGKTKIDTGPVKNPVVVKDLTPASVASFLRKQNHKVQSTKGVDGRAVLLVQLEQSGWQFDIEIEFTPDLRCFFLICPLGKPGAAYPAAQLTDLLKSNYRYAPAYFCIRDTDQRLCFEVLWGTQMSEADFHAAVNRFLGNIQTTHALWGTNKTNGAGGMP